MKSFFRSVGAVLAGFIFIGVTHTGTDAILESAGILPKGHLFVAPALILVVIGYRALFSLAGCYITARLAPGKPMGHALSLGLIGVILSSIGAIVGADLGPSWYAWSLAAIALPIAWLGGKIALRGRESGTIAETQR